MLATTIRDSLSNDTLPVCLWKENPNRLVSLWDIVKEFNVGEVVMALYDTKTWADTFGLQTYAEGPRPVSANAKREVQDCLKRAKTACTKAHFDDASLKLELTDLALDSLTDSGAIGTELRNVVETILYEIHSRKFIKIAAENEEYLDQEMLFGEAVYTAFPSATRDIKASGNCLATENGTACVFHLMRASEFALRALARDRDVEFKDKPLDEKEWGHILGALETKVSALRSADRKCWGHPELRDRQIRFYNEVVQELRSFNDAWRRHVSHADALAFYEEDDATGVFKHVRKFIEKLAAASISEASTTAQYWDSSGETK